MANSRLFRKAQNRSQGLGNSKDGYLGFDATINALKKSQVKKCEPYKFLLDVAKKLGKRRDELYFKILFASPSGQIKLGVATGNNKDKAVNGVNSEAHFVIGNVLTETIETTTRVDKEKNRRSIDEANKKNGDNLPEDRSSSKRSSSRKSTRYQKRKRHVPRRAKSKPSRKIPAKDSVVLKDFNEEGSGATTPTQFNTKNSSIPQKDFAAIFEDANNRLYDENQQPDILIDNPPGVAKFIGLGVDVDRPSIVCSTELSPIIYDDSLDVYEQVVLDRKLRLETVYKNLENVDTEDVDSMIEFYQEYRLLSEDAIDSSAVVSTLDERLLDQISGDMLSIAKTLGFNTSLKLSQIYAQVLHDLGGAGKNGTYDTEKGVRRSSVNDSNINIDENYPSRFFTGFDITRIKKGAVKDAANPSSYQFGSRGSLLGYLDKTDPDELRNAGGSTNLGRTGVSVPLPSIDSIDDPVTNILNAVYYELMMSKLVTTQDSNVLDIKESGYSNITRSFLGEFSDPRKSLNDVSVPEQLSAIIKFNQSNENYFPLEQFIPSGSGLKGRTFLDAVIQPAIGALIEDEDPNFDLLNSWTEKTRTSLDNFFKYTDAAYLDGGAPIVYNEIVLALVKCITDPNASIGTKHPKFAEMSIDRSRTSDQVANLLRGALPNIVSDSSKFFGHIYNTMGYGFFEGQDNLVNSISRGSLARAAENYKIGTKSQRRWDPNAQRKINDGEAVSFALNLTYSELSRLFNLLENNLMTSIDLLLADAGLISLSEPPSYNTAASGFFESRSATVVDDQSRPGNYEATAFSGIPRLYIRSLLAICVNRIASQSGGWISLVGDSARAKIVRAAKVAVENIDIENGPVRWKVTHGQWPPESGDTNDLSSEDYNKLVPDSVRAAREGEIDVDIETDSSGTPTSINVSDPTAGWDFIDSLEGFCPLTLMLDGEDNSEVNLSVIRGNRALFDDHYDDIVMQRTRLYKMKQFLEKPFQAYQRFPETLEEAAGKLSLDSLKTLAELPGLDGQEIVKFTSPNQVGNMKKSLRLESPSVPLRYMPNKYAINDKELFVARRFVDDYMQKNFSDQSKCVVQTVGIPTGLLSAENISREAFSLTREAEFMFYPDLSWSPKLKKYHPNVYLIPGSFNSCDQNSSYDEIVSNTRFFVASDSMSQMMRYSEVVEFLNLDRTTARELLTNHCLDHSLSLTLKMTTGVDFSEDTFRLSPSVNRLLVTPDGQKNIETLLKSYPEGHMAIFKENGIDSSPNIAKILADSTLSEINSYLAALDCRLISPEDMSKKVLAPRMFDRVFNIFAHPDEHYSLRDSVGLKSVGLTIDGQRKTVFQIDLKEQSGNSVKNDHFASYYYKVEKL